MEQESRHNLAVLAVLVPNPPSAELTKYLVHESACSGLNTLEPKGSTIHVRRGEEVRHRYGAYYSPTSAKYRFVLKQ